MLDKTSLDALDRKLLKTLSRNGQLSAGKVADELGVTAPTARSRMKNLIKNGVLKIVGLINPMATSGLTIALVGISLKSHQQLDEKLEQISMLDRVNWCAVITGRYDLIAEIICSDMGDLYDFLDKDLSRLGGIHSSESFVVMKSRRKWLYLPTAVADSFSR